VTPRRRATPGVDGLGFETRAIHAGQPPDPVTGAVVTPISQSSTFAQRAPGEHQGFEYSRTSNPTRLALEQCIASLEGARHGFAFGSGMAATDAVMRLLVPGDHIVIPADAYGGTYRLVSRVLGPAGITFTPVDLTDPELLAAAWRAQTKLIWVESPTNPLLTVVDIAAVAQFAHERGAWCAVDNTFATPYLQRPLPLGADAVVHSTTKYLGGHSDLVGGFVAVSDDDLATRIGFIQNAVGAVPGPFDCFLALRGVKTLAVRMQRHCQNAQQVAHLLDGHEAVEHLYYPGLPSHPTYEVARTQMRDFGGMVSFTVHGGDAAARALVQRTHLFTLAESLGAVESLIEHPASMTHASVAGSPLEVDPALVRLSVGLETAEDLIDDLRAALDTQ
jgi:cystathionine gamma-synthase